MSNGTNTENINKIVISDTTAITYLAKIKALYLLKSLFKIIYIPEAVYDELTRQGDHIPGSKEVKTLPWIKVEKVRDIEKFASKFKIPLHEGELQAICLALQKNADLLIMDERDGRQEATNQGLRITGMLGIFLKAKENNLIPAVRPFMDKLRLTNFKLKPELYTAVLKKAGELEQSNSA